MVDTKELASPPTIFFFRRRRRRRKRFLDEQQPLAVTTTTTTTGFQWSSTRIFVFKEEEEKKTIYFLVCVSVSCSTVERRREQICREMYIIITFGDAQTLLFLLPRSERGFQSLCHLLVGTRRQRWHLGRYIYIIKSEKRERNQHHNNNFF